MKINLIFILQVISKRPSNIKGENECRGAAKISCESSQQFIVAFYMTNAGTEKNVRKCTVCSGAVKSLMI